MPRTVVCVGTGPSVTEEQVDTARQKGFDLYACNLAYRLAPDCKLLYAVNYRFWKHYWPEIKHLPAERWTTNARVACDFPVRLISEVNKPGLSPRLGVIHHGHGSGYSLVSMAHQMGYERIILLGYDLKYAEDYDGRNHRVGSSPRHFFGEYPTEMQHWPSVMVKDGVHFELVELYRSIAEQGLVEVINCSPGSAIDCFERMPISAVR